MAQCKNCKKSISKLEVIINYGICNECSMKDLDNIDVYNNDKDDDNQYYGG